TYYPIEKRLIDAQVYFDLENYPKAAVLLIDATMNRAFATHPERMEVLYQLGFSLLQLRNFVGARETLEQVAAAGPGAAGQYYDKALRYLIEIGLSTRSGAGLEAAIQKIAQLPVRGPETQYAFGKGLTRLGRHAEAALALGLIPAGTPEYAPSQFYVGVALTEQDQFKDAITAFQRVFQAAEGEASGDRPNKDLLEMARMSLARLYLETGDFDLALEQYSEIERGSPFFFRALYEMCWTYVNAEKYDRALNALELLLLTAEEDGAITDAQILRGRLNIQLERGDAAQEAYSEVLQRFRPIRTELDVFSRDKDALKSYFRWLTVRNGDAFATTTVLSDRAKAWIENDPQLKILVGLFDDMSQQRIEVGEANQIVREIDEALSSESRLESFPNLSAAWTRVLLAKNELMDVSSAAIEEKERLALQGLDGGARDALLRLIEKRSAAESALSSAPRRVIDFERRVGVLRDSVTDLKREAYKSERRLEDIGTELRAIESWLSERRFADGGDLSSAELAAIETVLNERKKHYTVLSQRQANVGSALARRSVTIGAGDASEQTDERNRKTLLDVHSEIERLADTSARGKPGFDGATNLRRRAMAAIGRLDQLQTAIENAARQKAEEFRGEVEAERKLLEGYERQVAAFGRDSDRMSRDVGAPLFRDAMRRLDDYVLEADVGVIDVAYRRKQRETERISDLQLEREEMLKRLEESVEAMNKP
ncbi:MAG: tetratricopeptide repeat protein, partial [Myxococcales bacterium]|nr:tetratricopeptide repeat protein [Myxococcales bacterium]